MRTISLIPTYGRDYKYRSEVLADLRVGKDFILVRFGQRDLPINLEQIRQGFPGAQAAVRYAGLARLAVFTSEELSS